MRQIFSPRRVVLLGVAAFVLAAPAAAEDGIVNYSKGDARMNAAMAKGLSTLPDFDAALQHHLRGILNVRVPYGADGNEYFWLGDVRRDADGSYDGTITNVVAHVPGLQQGMTYHARRDQVADWMYRDDRGGDHGGWTVRLMQDDEPELKARSRFHFVE